MAGVSGETANEDGASESGESTERKDVVRTSQSEIQRLG